MILYILQIYIYIYIYICLYIYVYECTYVHINIYIYVYIFKWYLREMRIPHAEHFSLNFNGTIRYND